MPKISKYPTVVGTEPAYAKLLASRVHLQTSTFPADRKLLNAAKEKKSQVYFTAFLRELWQSIEST